MIILTPWFNTWGLLKGVNFYIPLPQQTGTGKNKGNGNTALGGHDGNAVYAAPCISKSSSKFDSNLYWNGGLQMM